MLYNFLVDGCVDCGLQKTQWSKTSRWHGSPNHHRLWKLHTGLQATWILCLSTLPPDSGTLISKLNAKFTFIWKGDFDHWATVEFFFSLAQVRCFWRCFDELWTATPFSNDPLWLTLFVEGVNDRLRDHCRVSSVPHYCDFKEQEIPTIYTVWMVINWNSNVNILIFWDTNFWLSLAVSSNNLNIKKKLLKCFTLHVMNIEYMKVSLFEISYKKK